MLSLLAGRYDGRCTFQYNSAQEAPKWPRSAPESPTSGSPTLAKLLTGHNACEWAGGFKAHHENWTKPPSDFDSSAWMLEHTALLNEERESRERQGYTVTTENQNLFRLRGNSATIAGKPDLIADKNHEVVVIDVKTGRPSPSHLAQVRIYQYAVPKALQQFQGRDARGQVRYPDSFSGSPASAVNPEFIRNMGELIRRLADQTPARRVPSAQACRFCDITPADCPARIHVTHVPEGSTEDF